MSDAPHMTSVTVRIAGEEHTIRSNAEPEYTRRCADLVDQRISEIRDRGLVEGHRAAILAALSITDSFFRVEEEAAGQGTSVDERLERLADRVEKALR